jgi:spore germination protein KC
MEGICLKLIRCIVTCSLLFLSGCWDHEELTEYVFVQSLAIDQTKDGKIKLTTQFYKPAPKIASAGGGGGESYLNIETEAKSVFDAIRDITIHIGRKANWGHVRFIIVSDKAAKKYSVAELLDFFYRDHEPRLLTGIGITKGNASDFLKTKPHVENTVSEQLNEATKTGSKFSGKTYPANFYTFGKQIHSEVDTAYAPYLVKDETKMKNNIFVDGLAVLQKGKLKTILSNQDTKYLVMALDQFKFGILELPCKNKKLKESFEVIDASSETSLTLKNDVAHYYIKPKMQIIIGELHCTAIEKGEQLRDINNQLNKMVNKHIQDFLTKTQKENLDIIGLGNDIYRSNPQEWNRIKKEKIPYYQNAVFHIDTEVNIMNTGTDISKPFSQK